MIIEIVSLSQEDAVTSHVFAYEMGGDAVKYSALNGQNLTLIIDGVTLTGAEAVANRKLKLIKSGDDLIVATEDGDTRLVELTDFYAEPDIALSGDDWVWDQDNGLLVADGGRDSYGALLSDASSAAVQGSSAALGSLAGATLGANSGLLAAGSLLVGVLGSGGAAATPASVSAAAGETADAATTTTAGDTGATVSITGDISAGMTEANAVQSAQGVLNASSESGAVRLFNAQIGVAGNAGYGTFSITEAGAWTYTMASTHDEFEADVDYTDSIVVSTADGVEQVITVTIKGTNDAAVVASTSVSLQETNAVLVTQGVLTATDVDNADNTFTANSTTGTTGVFSIDASGAWTFTANNAFDHLNAGEQVTETFAVTSVDGTASSVTITINGSNDAAVISGTSAATVSETDAVQSVGGALRSVDVDGTDNLFNEHNDLAGANGFGKFTVSANGEWTYIMDSAHDEFAIGVDYIDSVTVTAADGSPQVVTVTITGTNDAAVIGGETAGTVTEAGGVANGSIGRAVVTGHLTSQDVDGQPNAFTAVTQAHTSAGGYGHYVMGANGAWTYTLDNDNPTVEALVKGESLRDSFTIAAADGTTQVVNVTIEGANDAGQAVIDLGIYGNLISPLQVEGKWYYQWDMNADGVIDPNVSREATPTNKLTDDFQVMAWLEQEFFGGASVTENNRNFTVDGVDVALPTIGAQTVTDLQLYEGTAWSTGTPNYDTDPQSNPSYDDLLAIWDAFNGTATDSGAEGLPAGWYQPADVYASANQISATDHAVFGFFAGQAFAAGDAVMDASALYILQVL